MLKTMQPSTAIVTLAVRKCRWTSILKTAKDIHAILAAAVTNTHTPQREEITGVTVPIEIQETTGISENTNETGGMREITEAIMTMTVEISGLGRKTSP